MRHLYAKIFSRSTDPVHSSSSSSSSRSGKDLIARSWPWFSLAFGVLWLVPAVFVLALSFQDYIVGRSVGCLNQSSKKCQLDLHATTQIQQAQALEKYDQQAQAGLQLAAKALEAWFCLICASLVWSILKRLAGRDDRDALPVGYLHVHTECQDIRIIPKLFWGRRRDASRLQGWNKTRLYLYIVFITSICILCNLMGSATAILVIPNIKWMPINEAHDVWFQNVMAASGPLNASIARSCNEAFLKAGKYSCTYKSYGSATDMVIAAAVATNDQSFTLNDQPYRNRHDDLPLEALLLPPIMQEANVSFTVNISGSPFMWTPSRQTLRDISVDLTDFDNMTGKNPTKSEGYPRSDLFNHTLQTRLQRRGPVLGQRNLCYRDLAEEVGVFPVEADRDVRCYNQFNEKIWKCIPWGTAWTDITQAWANFTIGDAYATIKTTTNNSTNSSIAVSIYSTSTSLEMDNTTYHSIRTKKRDFNWGTAFDKGKITQRNLSGPQQIFEYRRILPQQGTINGQTVNLTDFVWCDSQTMLGLADYVLNPSQVSNTIRLTEMNVITEETSDAPAPQQIFMHPEWSLAAWSVDRTGANNVVGVKRGACRKTILAMENWVKNGDYSQEAMDFRNIHKFVAAQTLSLMPYSTTSIPPTDPGIHPPLWRKAMIQVWKYDLQSSSSKFGIVVLLFGVMCVIARTCLYYLDRNEMMDATEILVQTLKTINSHRRSSSTPSLLPGTPELEQLDEDGEEDEKQFPVVQIKPVTPPDPTDRMKRISYKRRVSFHG